MKGRGSPLIETSQSRVLERLRENNARLRKVLEVETVGVMFWDLPSGVMTDANDTFLRVMGYSRMEVERGELTWQRLTPPEYVEISREEVRKFMKTGRVGPYEKEYFRKDGTRQWFVFAGSALSKSTAVEFCVDISERKRSEQRLAQLNRAYALLAGVDRAIVQIGDEQGLLDAICHLAVDKGGFKLAWVGMAMPDGSVCPTAQAGAVGYVDGLRVVVSNDVPEGRGPTGTAIRENRCMVIQDIETDLRMYPWRVRAREFGLQWVAAFPLRVADKVVGAIQFYAPRSGFFDEDELQLLGHVSDDLSHALTALQAIGERNKAEEQLRKSQEQLTDFFQNSPLGLLWVDPQGLVVRASQSELELLGRKENEICGRSVVDLHVEPAAVAEAVANLARHQEVHNLRVHIRHKSGALRHVRIDANGLWEKGQLVHSRWFVRDITRQAELEREILTISEREQRRLGHDLHDDLCQQLAGIEFLSEVLARELKAKSAREAAQAAEIAQCVRQTMTQTHELARGLSPVSLEADGLMGGLRELAERTSKLFRVRCHFRCQNPVLVRDHSVAVHLFRIAQEAVGNAVKHGKAGEIDISLAAFGKSLRMSVHDDGTGIPEKLTENKGMGLRIMRYRADVIGASLVVQRLTRGGTGVLCSVPNGGFSGKRPKRR